MDQFFNPRAARWARDLVAKMDRDEAELFVRAATFDILMADIEANRRTVEAHAREVHKRLAQRVSKALTRSYSDEQASDYLAAAAAVSIISKAAEWESEEHPRDNRGRFKRKGSSEVTFTFSRKKNAPEVNLTQALGRTGGKISEFEREWNKVHPEQASTNRRAYDRIAAGSRLLSSSGNPKMMAAGQFGEFVGRYGPEAEKVIGPHMRRTAYRYRGTERRIDNALIQATNDKTRDMMRGQKNPVVTPDLRSEASRQASITYLIKRLPSSKLTDLQLKSGKVPPSEGVIINADGKIITQASGFSDDHYLPFNLKNLKGLQGGQYVRSRATGGPTTEDIYAGLVSGARSVTVVSRSGVFTIDFDDAFRGSRRYNDKAAQMVGRYGKLLDAIKSEQVERTKLSPEDRARLREEVESEMHGMGYSIGEIERAVQQRIKEYKANPELSREELAQIDREARDAGGGDERKYRIARADMIDAAMENKASNKYRLDGEGYSAALDALREQFPYYIERINYIHRKSEGGAGQLFSTEPDTGYVAPRYLRPQAAQEGYFDREINGRGKISAKHTNYANWQHNPERGGGRTEEVSRQTEETHAPKKNPTDALRVAQRRAATTSAAKESLYRAVKALGSDRIEDANEVLKRLAGDQGAFDAEFADPIRRRRLHNLVTSEFNQLDHDQLRRSHPDFYNQVNEALKTYNLHNRALEQEVATPEALSEALGNSPETPFTFHDRPEYRLGEATRERIERAAEQLGTPVKLGELSDADLRRRANGWGGLARRLRESGEIDPVDTAQFLVDSGLDTDQRAVNFHKKMTMGELEPTTRSAMALQAEGNATQYERLRRLQANWEAQPKEEIEAPQERQTTFEHRISTNHADELDTEAAEHAQSPYPQMHKVAAGMKHVAGFIRELGTGDMTREEFVEALDDVLDRYDDNGMIQARLKKMGILG